MNEAILDFGTQISVIFYVVHGKAYAYGAHGYSSTGIFVGKPRQCGGFTFRKSVLVGTTEIGPEEVKRIMEELADVFRGNAYNLITKNCNHFCNDVCIRLTGKHIPSWVNRLAGIGFLFYCVIPTSPNSTKVRHLRAQDNKSDEVEEKNSTSDSDVVTCPGCTFCSFFSPSENPTPSRTTSEHADPPPST